MFENDVNICVEVNSFLITSSKVPKMTQKDYFKCTL